MKKKLFHCLITEAEVFFFRDRAMSKKKGVSAEEKRSRMLQLFHEKRDFFQLKELEKIAPKEKGIIVQSVKEVVQSLVDDGLVDTDKIGTSVYFWSFPSKAKQAKKRKLSELEEKVCSVEKKVKSTNENLEKAKGSRKDTEERKTVLSQIKELKLVRDELKAEVNKLKDNDPEFWNGKKDEIKKAKEAANRWTDNIFAVKSWCKTKFNIEEETLEKHFGIPSELDYID